MSVYRDISAHNPLNAIGASSGESGWQGELLLQLNTKVFIKGLRPSKNHGHLIECRLVLTDEEASSVMAETEKLKDWFAMLKQTPEQQFDIEIAADGRWFHQGGEIRRPELVKLFASVLMRDAAGAYWLVTPVEKGRITVRDAPFIVTAYERGGTRGRPELTFVTNIGETVMLDSAHELKMLPAPDGNEIRPYLVLRDGLLAKLSRPVYYQLSDDAVTGRDGLLGVWSAGIFFPLEG